MGIQTHFDKFHTKIKLGRKDAAYKKARERDDSISLAINAAFKRAGYPVVANFIQGSLATNTAIVAISGDSDVDRALVIDGDDAPENPVEPKIKVLDVLERRGFKKATIKKPCVTADYSSESVHIDFPIYMLRGNQYYLAVGKRNSDSNNREWSAADPKGLLAWINDTTVHGVMTTEKHDQYRRLVRYLKRWRDYNFSESVGTKIYSIGITVMVKQCFSPSLDSSGARQDLTALRQTLDRILNGGYFMSVTSERYKVSVALPVEPWRDIFSNSSEETGTQFRNKLFRLWKKLIEVERMDDEGKQCAVLSSLFGDDFMVSNEKTDKHTPQSADKGLLRPASAALPSVGPTLSFPSSPRIPKKPDGFA